ncbi:MAG: LysR family transcriptional regulator [Staphylococcus equorum]|uniref:cidABC operon transcriptional activator CidR n=1 Tax=Staphylococcus TaxID=1279 RepID=UPI000852EE86|nr:LysR family transcriptional regulator [Staphylococcus equorum]MDG0821973.1 LysR family transcriptional regulator [Staphylococcus equorum]MDG0838474.1 LysR family transcriptional regulator [Staphylococcus equorum]MDK9871730.1 LysR family transcriptional regulator [Staphylococcus equorum]MDK9877160.1 LysR family transcriptional regulator [Staphylococcus equorum]MDN5829036.1 LysR family transcriptional regulator [Staphylococcus equorum]
MEIKQMKYFVEVVRNGGMTQASEHLYIAQSTISKNIKSIENEFDITLFDRRKKHIILTDIGQIFYDKCVEALAVLDDLSLEMGDVTNLERGHIRIGISAIMNVRLFTESLNQFHSKYPNVTYEVIEGGGKAVEFYLNNDEIDVGITTLPVDEDIYHAVPLYKEKLLLIVDKNSELAQQSSVYLGDLKDESFIMFHDDYYLKDQIIESCRKVGFHPKTVAKMSQITFIENMIRDGIGVSILPESIVNILNDGVVGIEISAADVAWNLGVIWKKESYMNHVTHEWINFLKDLK